LTQEHIDEMVGFYAQAKKLTRETGVNHEVDHIYPLQGKDCSGLHVPWNLQVLTKQQNTTKNNRTPIYDDKQA
jgi:5-methylcytosine-specific restriction endonuclease McrA